MKLFTVDAKIVTRKAHGYEEPVEGKMAVVQIVDTEKGCLKTETIGKKPPFIYLDLIGISQRLLEMVLNEKPDKIVFDEVGLGRGLKDNFRLAIADLYEKVVYVPFNGTLIYP